MTKEELLKEMDQMRKSMKRLQKSEASCKEAADLFRKREQEYREMVELANKAGETATYRLWVERSKRAPGWLDEKGAALEVELPGGGFEPAPQEKG